MSEQLETWDINARINAYMLQAVAPEAMTAQLSGKGRNVGEQFAHLHNVRLMWLRTSAPDLAEPLGKIEKSESGDKDAVLAALEASARAIHTAAERAFATGGKIKGFKPHVSAFIGYLIAHEAHHRGQIAVTLKQAGFPLDKKILFGMWEWGVR